MSNGETPAMPVKVVTGAGTKTSKGLTKREMFAMHAMQGILSNSGGVIQANSRSGTSWCNCDASGLAQWSLECADALLAELEK
ncbi:hypothetical protein J8Z28_07570 [Pseudoalteromonas sp. SCSIO 43088]|uniref:hypothetical protein n=1 Tax=Pseudoalteromonas sp. SCSIO 43088 TaxID=2822846 RepID=UPI00202AFB88|nr:hypothetical protein [Pseudoalteromonas sp. SCSIO 43088]URQ87690.1 hypothetical protein J8Z28_07570 [Pseudoalteromonas sp. SCSIO 43088]